MTWKRKADGSYHNAEGGWLAKRERIWPTDWTGKTWTTRWTLYGTHTRLGSGAYRLVGHYRTLGEAKKAASMAQPPGSVGQRSVIGGALAAVAASVPAGFGFAFGSTWGERVARRVFGSGPAKGGARVVSEEQRRRSFVAERRHWTKYEAEKARQGVKIPDRYENPDIVVHAYRARALALRREGRPEVAARLEAAAREAAASSRNRRK